MLRRAFHLYWWFARGMTLGVRAVVLDDENRVFLVKHSYVSGWHLPGGGVEVGETFIEALRRELVEEGRIELAAEPVLHGLFFNDHVSRRDHVAVYVVRRFTQDRPARAEPRDHCVRLFRRHGAARGDHQGYAVADRGGARGQGARRHMALGVRFARTGSRLLHGAIAKLSLWGLRLPMYYVRRKWWTELVSREPYDAGGDMSTGLRGQALLQ